MAEKLKSRPINSAPTNLGVNAAVSLSWTGKWLHLFDSTEVTRTWRWNGSAYEYLGDTLVNGLQFGEMTEDETYIVGLNSGTTQRLQLRTVNPTTGATTIVHGLSSTTIPVEMDGGLIRITGDYYVVYNRNKAPASIYLVKLDRATNTLILKHTISITNVVFALLSYATKVPGKPAIMYAQRLDTNVSVNILRVNLATEQLQSPTALTTGPNSTGGFTSVAISDDALFWYGQHPTNPTLNRRGTINSTFSGLTLTGTTIPTAKAGVFSAFAFQSRGIFTPKVTAGGPYDQYQLFNAATGAISDDVPGTFSPMDAPAGQFSPTEVRRNYDSTPNYPRKYAMMGDRSLTGVQGLYVYEEIAPTDFFAQGLMGDAFSSMQPNTTLNLRAEGLMGDAFSSMLVRESTLLFAQGIMGDATIRASDQSGILLAQGVMGDAWATAVVEESVRFSDYGLMGDAYSLIQVNDAYSFVGIGPIADAFAVMSDENASFVAVAPMGDAFVRFSDERVTFFAAGPMGDAFSVINVDETTALFAQGVMGDAFALTDEDDFPVLFEAEGIMGDAFAITTGDFTTMIAMGIMGDAGIGMSIIPRGCRRRAMMVQNVI